MALDRRPIEQMIADVGATAFQRLAELFIAETRDAVREMRRLCVAGDWRELGRQAHSLKNSTASFGLHGLVGLASGIEAAADAGRAAEAEQGVSRFEATAGPAVAALEAEVRAIDG